MYALIPVKKEDYDKERRTCHEKAARICLILALLLSQLAVSASASDDYTTSTVDGHATNYVTIDMTAGDVSAGVMIANGSIVSAQSVAGMAQDNGAFAAINGTYFSAYDGYPVPWGTIMKDGQLLFMGSAGSVAGITSDGKLVIDRVKFSITAYINGSREFTPWWINYLGTDSEAVMLFTPIYQGTITPSAGARAVLVGSDGRVASITTDPFTVPDGGFVVLFNEGWARYALEWFQVGDLVTYETKIQTTFTDPSQWADVREAVGAGPSLIINGVATADGEAEGFTEAKINTNRAGRSFIGATADGKILIGTIDSATLKEAAAVCQQLNLVNAMCLDGGGSIALYYNGSKTAGRDVNNALGFFRVEGPQSAQEERVTAYGRGQEILVDGETVTLQAYNVDGNNFFKLRDLAWLLSGTPAQFSVAYDSAARAVSLTSGQPYAPDGSEGGKPLDQTLLVEPTTAKLYVNGAEQTVTAYNIGGNNYFRLRDLGQMLDFGVGYDSASKLVIVDPSVGYTE